MGGIHWRRLLLWFVIGLILWGVMAGAGVVSLWFLILPTVGGYLLHNKISPVEA